MDWDDLKFFLAVARRGSIRAAAQVLDVNHATVSRRINAFEEKIAVRLFERLPRGYVLTPAGEEMFASAERIDEEIAALDRRVIGRDTQLSGRLRVTAPQALVTHVLMPGLVAFSEAYPGIEMDIIGSYAEFNLTKREADIAIRLTDLSPPDHLVGRRVAHYYKAVYASRPYLARHDPVAHPEAMHWLGWEDEEPYPPWVKSSAYSETRIRHNVNDPSIHLAAVRAGLGISMLPCFLADPDPELERLPPGEPLSSRDVWILTHKDLRHTARVRTFMDFIAEVIKEQSDLLEGRRGGS